MQIIESALVADLRLYRDGFYAPTVPVPMGLASLKLPVHPRHTSCFQVAPDCGAAASLLSVLFLPQGPH